jgi:hypothetical protein
MASAANPRSEGPRSSQRPQERARRAAERANGDCRTGTPMALLLKTPTGSSPLGVASSVRKLFAQRKATVGGEMHSRATPQVGPRSTQPARPRLAVQPLARRLRGSNRYKRRVTNRPAHGAARTPFGGATGRGLDSRGRWSSLPHSVIPSGTVSSRAVMSPERSEASASRASSRVQADLSLRSG